MVFIDKHKAKNFEQTQYQILKQILRVREKLYLEKFNIK